MMRISTLARVGLLLLTTACIETLEPSKEKSAYVSAIAHTAGAGTFQLRLTGAFYQADEFTSSLDKPETCGAYPYTTQTSVGSFPTMSAGDRLYTNVGGRVDTLFKTSLAGLLTYQLVSVPGIPFVVGDSLMLTVPGDVDGFPAVQAKVRVAEPFTYDPIGTAGDGEALPLTWVPAATPGALMIFSLRFNTSGVSEEPDTQIYCVLLDDGSHSIEPAYAVAWGVAPAASRSVYASRARRTRVEVDGRTRLSLYSFFDLPTPASPAP